MSAPSTRRLAIAIGTAAASVTIAIGVTAGSLLGWFRPSARSVPPPPATSPVILVPVAPTPAPSPAADPVGDLQLAMDETARSRGHDDDDDDDSERWKHGRDHDDREDDDDDD